MSRRPTLIGPSNVTRPHAGLFLSLASAALSACLLAAACGSFGGSDAPSPSDGAAPGDASDNTPNVDANGSGDGQGAAAPTDVFDCSTPFPCIRGVSKATSKGPMLDVPVPSQAKKGDLLVLLYVSDGGSVSVSQPVTAKDSLATCNNVNEYTLDFASRVNDATGTAFTLAWSSGATVQAMAVAIGQPGPVSEVGRNYEGTDAGGAAPARQVTSTYGLSLAVFGHVQPPGPDPQTPMKPYDLLDSLSFLSVFAADVPHGSTGDIGPWSSTTPICWGTLSITVSAP